ncbi:hypothetical protein FQN54_009038 [Arachnomyces sp. PD_36]|nr:hypothetical protein FQN54_009038 [Arachnomyces sp. PD_36]
MAAVDDNQSKLTVYRGWLEQGKHVWSPFVIKLEARLRFAGIPYRTESGSTQKGPKGKIPYVVCPGYELDGTDPATLGDSTLIIKQLVEWDVLPDLNSRVSAVVRAQDLSLRALLEEKLYFYHTRERWGENYYEMRDHVLSALPYPMRIVIGYIVSRKTMQTLHGQGTGRYTADEIASFRLEIWGNINELLVASKTTSGDDKKPFWVLGGEDPTESDGVLFGFIVSVLICTACPDSRRVVQGFPVVVEYASRIHDVYFPDYEKWE